MLDLGLFLVSSAIAPVLGPVGATKAAVTGIVAGQVVKTGATAYYGGDISKSLLTPQEILSSAETGIIFVMPKL